MRISELAQLCGVTPHALRHYEKLGLLKPARSAGGYRDYPDAMRREVVFISMSRKVGFSLHAIAEQLPAFRAGRLGIDAMVDALRCRMAEIDLQVAGLNAQRAEVVSHIAWLQAQRPKPPASPFNPSRKRNTP
jgi:DNA-binding transcriptional MerR regulator